MKQLDKLEATKKANEAANYKAAPVKDTVSFEDFEKLDIRVGHVKNCEKALNIFYHKEKINNYG